MVFYGLGKLLSSAPKEGPHPPGWRLQAYPLTVGGKITHYPHRFRWENLSHHRYFYLGLLLMFPIFYKFEKMSKHPDNYKFHEERRRKEREHAMEHWR